LEVALAASYQRYINIEVARTLRAGAVIQVRLVTLVLLVVRLRLFLREPVIVVVTPGLHVIAFITLGLSVNGSVLARRLKMIINGVNVKRYSETFSRDVISSVNQYLSVFKCCGDLNDALSAITSEWLALDRKEAERLGGIAEANKARRSGKAPRKTNNDGIQEMAPLLVVIGDCPRCGSNLKGEPMPQCEKDKSGRHFYAECSACTYHYEIFKKRNKYAKMEGG
jgi:hypothetical protein